MAALNNRILVIDDNKAIQADFRKVLDYKQDAENVLDMLASKLLDEKGDNSSFRQFKYEIEFASQGKEAISLVQQSLELDRPYSLAFVDFLMPPGLNGIETIKRIWGIDPMVQIVICTAYSDYSWEEIIKELGFNDGFLFLKKPFDNIEIRQIAYCLVAKWNLNNRLQMLLREQASPKRAT